ncbi:MAG: hypothetical protein BAJALOKI1v1_880002 [Promethearchaeota archaeon]|nr:MAG: hypothetical protein BAJALOKI1v1_880002 [Candidatus Lokiarchaeota archaeon]
MFFLINNYIILQIFGKKEFSVFIFNYKNFALKTDESNRDSFFYLLLLIECF